MRRLAALFLVAPLLVAPFCAALTAAPPAALAAPASASTVAAGLVAHRALYKLTLDHARGDVTSATGMMAYEVTDACDGWAVRQRLDMTVTNRDGQPVHMQSDYATYESKDGTRLNFRTRQTTETAVTEQLEGTATLDHPGGAGSAHYTVPKDDTKPLPPGTLFPMWHTATIISAAEAGKKIMAAPLFDGTSLDGAQDSSVAIIGWGKAPAPFPELAELPSGRVQVAFFDRGKDVILPDYQVGMRYWANGVADDLRMDFGDFVMSGKLSEFKLTPGHC